MAGFLRTTFALLLAAGSAHAASDEVTDLPNFKGSRCFKSYAGYVPVAGGAKKVSSAHHTHQKGS